VLKNSGTMNSFMFLSNSDVTDNYSLADSNRCLISTYDVHHMNNSLATAGHELYNKLELATRKVNGAY